MRKMSEVFLAYKMQQVLKLLLLKSTDCVGSGDLKGRGVTFPSPMESTMIPAS
jgi:hypothetical protein